MERIPVFNDSAMPIYVAGLMVPPGETRHFDRDQVPPHLLPPEDAPAQAEEAVADPLENLLEGNVAAVTAALAGMSLAELERIGELEQKGRARKGVLSAVAEALLSNAGGDAQNAGGSGQNEAEE